MADAVRSGCESLRGCNCCGINTVYQLYADKLRGWPKGRRG